MEKFELHILGCGSALPTTRHFPTSQIVNVRDKLFMIDCGEGAQLQFRKSHLKFSRLNHIFISHLHGDHCFGLLGLISTLNLLGRTAELHIHSPKGLETLLTPMLDFSRLQNGRIRMDCRPLDLVAELTDAVLFCEARIQREGLVLSYTEPEEMIPVYADPDRLRQVFINIMDNAIKYSAPGGRITVKLWAGEYKAFAEIIDQGRGIPPEDLENVKTKFYKGSNSVRGSGIGLALVDSIMTALDGTMDIKSTLGRGTVVTLGLPLYHKA